MSRFALWRTSVRFFSPPELPILHFITSCMYSSCHSIAITISIVSFVGVRGSQEACLLQRRGKRQGIGLGRHTRDLIRVGELRPHQSAIDRVIGECRLERQPHQGVIAWLLARF